MGVFAATPWLVLEDHDRWPIIEVVAVIGPKIGTLCFALARRELLHRCFIGMPGVSLAQIKTKPVNQGFQAVPDFPSHWAIVERDKLTCLRPAICCRRYKGRCSTKLLTATQTSKPVAAMPPSMIAAEIGFAVTVSQAQQAHWERIC